MTEIPKKTEVLSGLDRLLLDPKAHLQDGRIGFLCHPASVNRELRHGIDLFTEHPDIDLRAVFGPQHGLRGETQDNMIEWSDYRDPASGLPIYSLYGRSRKPTAAMLSEIDILVYDLQDIGSRYYTFIQTLFLVMEACQEESVQLLVLDRPNPINGLDVEGPILHPDYSSFVGLFPLPIRHAWTVAEIARYLKHSFFPGCPLEFVPMEGWRREMFFDETGCPWVLPSPNMPTLDTALVYPGLCLLEGTNVSEGRGTTRPFEISGAPWVDPPRLSQILETYCLPGVRFRPLHFSPTFHKFQGALLGGVQIHVFDRRHFKPFQTGLALLRAYRELSPSQFRWKEPPYEYETEKLPIDILCGTDQIRHLIEAGQDLDSIQASWSESLASFQLAGESFRLYG